jgi:hypothetical protein
VIETVEGFIYNVTFGPRKATEEGAADDAYLLRVTTTAKIPAERKKEEGETEEDSKAKDEAFAERKKQLDEKLADSKKLEGVTYQVTKFTVDPLLKNRVGLIKSAPPAQTQPQASGSSVTPPMLQRPPSAPAPRQQPARRPTKAVTPPIAIPPMPPKDEKNDEKPKEEPAEE